MVNQLVIFYNEINSCKNRPACYLLWCGLSVGSGAFLRAPPPRSTIWRGL